MRTCAKEYTRSLVVLASLLALWVAVVPRLQRCATYQARQQLFDARRIDPAAMFYTELDCLERSLDRTRHRFPLRRIPDR